MKKTIIYGIVFLICLTTVFALELEGLEGYDYIATEEDLENSNMTTILVNLNGEQRELHFPPYAHFCSGLWVEYFGTTHFEPNPFEEGEMIELYDNCTKEDYYSYITDQALDGIQYYIENPPAPEPVLDSSGLLLSQDIFTKGVSLIIEPISSLIEGDYENILTVLKDIDFKFYEAESGHERIGIEPESAPEEFSDGETIDLLDYASFTLASVKALDQKLDSLSGAEEAGTLTSNNNTISSNEDNDLVIDASQGGGDVIIRLG